MAVAIRPPTIRRQMSTDQGSKRVYTLHSSHNNVFAWRTSNENMKTATVVFRRQQDALLMAHMIERHVRQNKEWPSTTMFDFQLYTGHGKHSAELELIDIKQWDMENLKVYCVEAYLDMITLSTLTPTRDGYNLNGELLLLNVPFEFYADRLNQLWEV
jgi:hypothetical protein